MTTPPRCNTCNRPMRHPRSAPDPNHPERVRAGSRGMCARCYQADLRARGYVPPSLRAEQEARAARKAALETRLAKLAAAREPQPLPDIATLPLDDTTWQAEARCAQSNPEAFYPEKGMSAREAKRVCNGDTDTAPCPVRAECLKWALDNDERFGVWGGLSERERRKIARRKDTAA